MQSKYLCFIVALIIAIVFLTSCENETENSDMGYIKEDVNSDVPAELVGTWEVSEGLPVGLNSYSLTINEDGQVIQESQIENGEATSENATLSVDGDTITILDPNNTVLMTLINSNDQLTTQDLGEDNTIFIKKT